MGRALQTGLVTAAAVLGTCAAAAGPVFAVAAGAASSRPAGAGPYPTQPPRAALEDPICRQAGNPLDRAVAITALMRPVTGTERMQLEFSLLEKSGRRRAFVPVRGGDLGKWISPLNLTLGQRPADQWILRKQVVNLAGPAVYRFHVGFRWIDAQGHSLGREYHWAPPCQET